MYTLINNFEHASMFYSHNMKHHFPALNYVLKEESTLYFIAKMALGPGIPSHRAQPRTITGNNNKASFWPKYLTYTFHRIEVQLVPYLTKAFTKAEMA